MNIKTIVVLIVTLFVIGLVFYRVYEHELEKAPESCPKGETCVRFCCWNQTSCSDEDYFKIHESPLKNEIINLKLNFTILKGMPCKEFFDSDAQWQFYENGHINDTYDEEEPSITLWTHDQYCIDENYTINYCFENTATDSIKRDYSFFMLASIPFLIITFCVYGSMRELRNLHGKCLMCYVLSLIFLYISISTIAIWHSELLDFPGTCITLGYTFLASLLMCFFWLNVMCYDIWSTFRRGLSLDNMKRFLMYCGYAFGVPILITLIEFILNTSDAIPLEYKTNIGNKTCTIVGSPGSHGEIIYIYLPIIITISVNIVFYSITAYKIYCAQKETAFKGQDSKRHAKDKIRFFLYLRLFVIMGISWAVEVISWAMENSLLLYAVSVVNCMQGFIIFILFVWKSKVKKILARKYSTVFAGKDSFKAPKSNAGVTSIDTLEMTKYKSVGVNSS